MQMPPNNLVQQEKCDKKNSTREKVYEFYTQKTLKIYYKIYNKANER